jgi:polar amino acid transport system permease protein
MAQESAYDGMAARQVPVEDTQTRVRRTLATTGTLILVWIGIGFFLAIIFTRVIGLDLSFMRQWFAFIALGLPMTLFVSVVSICLAMVLALFGALGRLSKNPVLFGISTFYVSLIRGTPLLVQVYFVYLALPQVGIVLDAVPAGIIALSVCYGAYLTETFRAGIQSISHGQTEAAYALGMTYAQCMRRVILPQAFRVVIPPVGNEFVAMLKDSSLVSVMGVWEILFRAQKIGRQYFRSMETLIIAALFYWMLVIVFQTVQARLEARMARSERELAAH